MQHRGARSIFSFIFILQLISMLVIPNPALAAEPASGLASDPPSLGVASPVNSSGLSAQQPVSEAAPLAADTDLDVTIVSTPWASLDNKPTNGPRVFVVEAEVKNNGAATADHVIVHLDYDDPAAGWVLLPGEDPNRTIDHLPAQGVYRAYWFATYPTSIGVGHKYTVTAMVNDTAVDSTSDNSYGNPGPNMTVRTREVLNTGNSGITNFSANITVGVAFTVKVTYNLGTNPRNIAFSPVGNLDFSPDSYRLLSSSTRFYNYAGDVQTVPDRLYFSSVPAAASNAEVTFTFIALAAKNVRLCPFAAVGYNSNVKYDQFYCSGSEIIPISGQLSYSLTKQADKTSVQQGDTLTYTLHYDNTGTLPLSYVWFWDDVDPDIASIDPNSANRVPDPNETCVDRETCEYNRIAWYLGTIPAAGQQGSSGDLTFSVLIDGDGQDLLDGTSLVNHAHSGINPGSLPGTAALTATLTTPVMAPGITITKTDGKPTAQPGEGLPYTIHVSNQGSVQAESVMITDNLPADVLYEEAAPSPSSVNGQTLTWNNLGPIAPGGSLDIQLDGRVGPKAPEGEVLTNTVTVRYQNPSGHVFAVKTATDRTTVTAPVLSISKAASPDPVLVGNELTYTLTYKNDGPAPATNVVISDTIPTHTTFVSCDNSCHTHSDGDIEWDLLSTPAHSQGTVQFVVQVDANLLTGTEINNSGYGLRSDQSNFIIGPAVSTLVQREAAIIQGTAFIDTDGDGIFDTGEGRIPGVNITLPQANAPTTQPTDANGHYLFRVETQGPASVSAALPANYVRTTPGTVQISAILGDPPQTINFGYLPISNPTFGVIYGTVFSDLNHNGSQDAGETGLQGVTVTSTGAHTSPLTTNAYGEFTFRYDSSATYTVVETNPAGYLSVTPDSVNVPVNVSTPTSTQVDFADFHGIRVSGTVFNDQNANGKRDTGESGLSGAVIQVGAQSQTTGANGEYTLYAPAGVQPVDIQETDPADYVSTAAVPGTEMVVTGVNSLQIASPVAGTAYIGGDFGDVLQDDVVTVSGLVWDDNGTGGGGLANGLRDGAEPGLEGATIELSTGLSLVTGSDGSFLLYAPANQPVAIHETNPAGYVSTNALAGDSAAKVDNDTIAVSPLSAGSTSANNAFGDVDSIGVAVISGKVFDDTNADGLLDTIEDGISGVNVTLSTFNGATNAVKTDADGNYQFAVTPGTQVKITSANPGGSYFPTTPQSVYVTPPSAGAFPNNNFGYSQSTEKATIYGIVFNDVNANGVQDWEEPGIGNTEISLNGTTTQLTAQHGLVAGTYSFAVDAPGNATVMEKNFYGYRSTTPDQVVLNVELGKSYPVNFGDTLNQNVAAIYGTVFDDLNSNGIQDPGELGLAGVAISMTVGTEVETTITKSYGQYTYGFEPDEAGYHMIREQDPALPGYHSTTPDQVVAYVELGESYVVNFGDTQDSPNKPAVIMGAVFADLNADGIQQLSEAGLEGVTVELSTGESISTDQYGLYRFEIQDAGIVTVVETDPTGYHSTTPNMVVVDVQLDSTYVVNFGDDNSPSQASIFGTVFNDLNVNGVRDPNEPGLSGVTVSLQDGETVTVQTNAWGQYTFWVEATGTYTIVETDPTGWVSTAAIPGSDQVTRLDDNSLRVDVDALGMDLGENDFGDAETEGIVTISGMVWDDNGNGGGGLADGIKDPGEPALAGVRISLNTGLSVTTGPDGKFTLYAPAGQDVIIHETDPSSDYVSTNAIPGNSAEKVDNDTIKIASPAEGLVSTGNLFGDVLQADVSVTKSASADTVVAGGVLTYTITVANTGPAVASGVKVHDTLPAGITVGSIQASKGTFNPATGIWDVGDLGANPETLEFAVTVHSNVTGSLVNQAIATLNEMDPDLTDNASSVTTKITAEADLAITKSDSPDPVAPGGTLTYTLSYENKGLSDAGSVTITDVLPAEVSFESVVSQPAGVSGPEVKDQTLVWTLDSLAAGASGEIVYTVSVHPDALGSITNEATIGSLVPDPDETNNTVQENTWVGEPGKAYIYGQVFDDQNGNGVKDAGEVGLSKVTVTLDQKTTTTTDSSGNYLFSIDTAGMHSIVETDPAGYFSTTPNEVHIAVLLEHSYQVNFGDAPQSAKFSTIFGTVYEDANQNGSWDAGETGLPGVTLTLDGSHTALTDDYGRYSFNITTAGSHSVIETDLSGYTSTTPNQLNFQVALGQGYTGNFGDALACTCDGDQYEEDDDSSGANPIEIGEENSQDHTFCDDSQDWLTFTAKAGQVYTITTSSWGQRADTILALYDTDGKTILVSNDDARGGSADYSSQLAWEAPVDGNYYIKVTNRAGLTCCNTQYRIWVETFTQPRLFLPLVIIAPQTSPTSVMSPTTPNGVINHICSDNFEVDDTWEQAGQILPGVAQAHSFDSNPNLYAVDKDWVWFDARRGDRVAFDLASPVSIQAVMELWDSQGNSLGLFDPSHLDWMVQETGRFYLSVSPQSDQVPFGCMDVAGYNLTMSLTPGIRLYLPFAIKPLE